MLELAAWSDNGRLAPHHAAPLPKTPVRYPDIALEQSCWVLDAAGALERGLGDLAYSVG